MSRRKDGGPRSITDVTSRSIRATPDPPVAQRRPNPFTDPGCAVPESLHGDEFLLRPIEVADAERDFEAVVETRADLRLWEQSSWPADDFTVEANAEDLADLERRHAERRAFTFAVLDPASAESLGCVYIFPTTATFLSRATVTPAVEDAVWADVDAVVYFWVRASRIPSGIDSRLLAAVRSWLQDQWGFTRNGYVTNEQFEQQVQLLDGAGLHVHFELREPDKPGAYLVYG
ncbi:hypothetical protein SAMN04487846_0719 [Microbacterium sp. cf046]|uniref:GNAT family N-acetyltransferase n=1 Tax=Microbacterium sp. cf046 TaxID=1761803 RepID=UPI0008F15DC8|nr:hypothetical protein [Microbacterium sp. cf046]SFR92915.1 hypothetical protein SAMN04487846_0719 [Microbacterium sp. cf046]